MDIGLLTDSVSDLPYESALDVAVRIGATSVEIAAGGMSAAPHLPLERLLEDRAARERWSGAITERGLRLAALNCSAWLLHPVRGPDSRRVVERTMQLAGSLGVDKIVTMSGLPGDGPESTTPNWIWNTWPSDALALRERQWDECLALWEGLVATARREGVKRIALELHPWQLVYNVPTLRRLRDALGVEIGANMDPSHLFWQQMDPAAVIRELESAVYHVHIKDTAIEATNVALNGVLDHTAEPSARGWTFRAAGLGHDQATWLGILDALRSVGYQDTLSIENEDPFLTAIEGVESAAAFIREALGLAQA